MQVELARRHHHQQHQQCSNTNPNHYMNVSIPYSVPQSTTSNYHLLSDPNGISHGNNGNAMGTESSDSASSSAASSFVHLPLAGVGTNTGVDSISTLVGGGYDNVRHFFFYFFFFSFFWRNILFPLLDLSLSMRVVKSLFVSVHCVALRGPTRYEINWIAAGYSPTKISLFLVMSFFSHHLL